jgi:hypothetical protein
MNKKTVMIVVIVLILLLGLGGFMLSRKKSPAGMSTTSPATGEQTQPVTEKKSLRDLLSLGQSLQCTYTLPADSGAGTSTGTVYVSGKQMRSDISMDIQGKTTVSHVIVTGDTSYIWVDGQTQGMKMTIDPSATPVPTITGTPQSVDWDSRIDYNCSPWSVDSAMFELPSDIKFSDFSQMMVLPTGMVGGGSPAANNCSVCDSLSGETKTQCLTALGCN